MSGLEIERKFLVRRGTDLKREACASHRIKQGYFRAENTVRIRLSDDKAYLTIKGKSRNGGLTRYEFEKEITIEEATQLFELCEPGMIDKTRYLVRCGRHTYEIDEFYGENEGLVVAEIELGSEDEEFEKPAFLGPEVTGDRRFYNTCLRENPYSAWRDTLPPDFR